MIAPLEVDGGPVKHGIHLGDEVNLFDFPTPTWHELNGGRYIGAGSVIVM